LHPQPSTTQQLDSLADRLMYRLAYLNFGTHESLVVSHSWLPVPAAVCAVRNSESIGTPTERSRVRSRLTRITGDAVGRDGQAGDLAVGYSVSSSSVSPSIRFCRPRRPIRSVRWSEVSVVAGSGSQSGNSLTRWGTTARCRSIRLTTVLSGTRRIHEDDREF